MSFSARVSGVSAKKNKSKRWYKTKVAVTSEQGVRSDCHKQDTIRKKIYQKSSESSIKEIKLIRNWL